jgi:hypothetical protein
MPKRSRKVPIISGPDHNTITFDISEEKSRLCE